MSASSSALAASGSTTAAPSITPLKVSDHAEEPAGAVEEETKSPAEVDAAILDAKQELGQKEPLHDSNPDANQNQEIDSVEETIAKFQARWPYWVAEYESEMRKPPPAPTSPRWADDEFLALLEVLWSRKKEMQLETTVDDDRKQCIESIQKTVDRCMCHAMRIKQEEEERYWQKWRELTRLEQEGYCFSFVRFRCKTEEFISPFRIAKKAEKNLQETSRLQQDAEEELEKIRQEKIETIKRAAKQERERLMRKSERGSTLVEDGFPERPHIYSVDKTFTSTSCAGFQVGIQRPEDCIFRALHTLPPRKFADGVTWKEYRYSRVNLVRSVMTEVARTYQQSCAIIEDAELIDSNPSISVSRSPQEPMAIIHVEKEYKDIGARAYRQASKYLAILRLDCGVSAPIGIMSSYDKWQFCWHKYASPVAEATTIEEVRRFCAPEPVDADFSLCVSPVYSYDNPCLLQLLASFLVKAAHIPSCAPVTKPWLLYTRNEQRIRLGRLDLAKVRHYDMVPESADDELFWVKLMGRDSEGLVLQMATENGECCAAKLCEIDRNYWYGLKRNEILRERQKLCQKERDRWVEAYGKDCGVKVSQLAGRPVLLMPFYEPLSHADWEAPGTMDMVMDHFKELATRDEEEETRNGTGKRKVFHINIERRHVMWGDKNHTCVRLIDWGRYCKDASNPRTSSDVRWALDSDESLEEKEAQVSSLVQEYLAAAKGILQKPARAATVQETVEVITVPQAEDDFGDDYKTAFSDPFAELYDRDRAAFHTEMRKYWDGKE